MRILWKLQEKIKFLSILFFSINLLTTTVNSLEQDIKTMNTPLIEKISELIPSDKSFYYSFDDDTRRDISRKLIAAINTEGMILGTPDEVIIRDTNDEIPLLWLQRFLAIRKWQVEKKRNSFLIISNLQSGLIFITYSYEGQLKRFNFSQIPLSAKGNPPPAAEGIMAGIDMLDLRELLGNQLKTGKYAITMTQYDWVSNTAQIHLVDSTKNTPDIPKIPESVSRQIYKGYKTAAQNVKNSALFSPSLKPPAITQTGISVDVPQKVAKKDHRWMMHGSIRVPVALGAMVNGSEMHTDSSDTPCAIITGMIIVNKLDNREPSWITLKLPVSSTCKAGDIVDVSFSADLKQFNEEFADAGVYQVYVACGAFVAGPFALEVTR